MAIKNQIEALEEQVLSVLAGLRLLREAMKTVPGGNVLKDAHGRFTPAGRAAILAFYGAGGTRSQAKERFSITSTSATNYWAEFKRRQEAEQEVEEDSPKE